MFGPVIGVPDEVRYRGFDHARGAVACMAALFLGCVSEPPPLPRPATLPHDDPGPPADERWDVLEERVTDYNHALRTASLKLLAALPTLQQIRTVHLSTDPRVAYETEVDAMLDDVRFRHRMLQFWRDTMRLGGGATADRPSRDTAPALAAQIVVEQRPFTELFTQSKGTCPEIDPDGGTFVARDCDNGVPLSVGVLTDPGAMHQFYGNMAFRRVRWLQEVFVCTKFPAEQAEAPAEIDGAQYLSPWPIASIANAPIDFRDTESVVCANCHTTMNHIAPLFARFDAAGFFADSVQVYTPTVPEPVITDVSHWLAPGQETAWRYQQPVADLVELGQAVAADPAVAECAVVRFWNLVMSKEDVVTDLATVPWSVIEPYLEVFHAEGENLRAVLRAMLTSEDFVRR